MTTIRNTTIASIVAAALAAPAAQAQSWGQAGISRSVTEAGYVGRIEGGVPSLGMNYGFADISRDKDGNEGVFGQAQFSKAFGKGPIKPTIGGEYQFVTGARDLARAQLGLDAGWKGGFAGLRVAPKLGEIGRDNDLQVSLNGQHTYGRVTVGAWGDANVNKGEKPFIIGEGYGMVNIGSIKGKGVSATVYVPYTGNSTGVRVGARVGL